MFAGLADRPDLDTVGYAITWRGRDALAGVLPPSVRPAARPFPRDSTALAVAAHQRAGASSAGPGRVDVVHGTNFIAPPTQRAGRRHGARPRLRPPPRDVRPADACSTPPAPAGARPRRQDPCRQRLHRARGRREHFGVDAERVVRVYQGSRRSRAGDAGTRPHARRRRPVRPLARHGGAPQEPARARPRVRHARRTTTPTCSWCWRGPTAGARQSTSRARDGAAATATASGDSGSCRSTTGATSSPARRCSHTPRSTRASASRRSRRWAPACPSSPPSGRAPRGARRRRRCSSTPPTPTRSRTPSSTVATDDDRRAVPRRAGPLVRVRRLRWDETVAAARRPLPPGGPVKALVTGARGFVGRHLVAHLAEAGDAIVPFDATTAPRSTSSMPTRPSRRRHRRPARRRLPPRRAHPHRCVVGRARGGVPGERRGHPNVLEACARAGVDRVLVVGSAESTARSPPTSSRSPRTRRCAPSRPTAPARSPAEYLALQAHLGDGLAHDPGPGVQPHRAGPGARRSSCRGSPAASSPPSATGARRDRGGLAATRCATSPTCATSCAPTGSSSSAVPRRGLQRRSGRGCSVREVADALLAASEPTSTSGRHRPRHSSGRSRCRRSSATPTKLAPTTGWTPARTLDETLADVLERRAPRRPS